MSADLATLNATIRRKTGFTDFADMLDAGGNYRPTIDVSQADLLELADAYDAAQAERGDARRAFRYGRPYVAPTPPPPPPKPATVAESSHGRVYANQAKRPAVVVALDQDSGTALIEYEMPAGRTFLWEVPATTTWKELHDPDTRYTGNSPIKNISPNRLPKRWKNAFGEHQADQESQP